MCLCANRVAPLPPFLSGTVAGVLYRYVYYIIEGAIFGRESLAGGRYCFIIMGRVARSSLLPRCNSPTSVNKNDMKINITKKKE